MEFICNPLLTFIMFIQFTLHLKATSLSFIVNQTSLHITLFFSKHSHRAFATNIKPIFYKLNCLHVRNCCLETATKSSTGPQQIPGAGPERDGCIIDLSLS